MSESTIFWSVDCLYCLCHLPHTVAQHTQEVERARYERHMLREEGKRELADGELDEERMAWERATWVTRSFRVGGAYDLARRQQDGAAGPVPTAEGKPPC